MTTFVYGTVEFIVTEKTAAKLQAQIKEQAWEFEGWKEVQAAHATAVRTNHPDDWSFYSDIYKDYYGHRPF